MHWKGLRLGASDGSKRHSVLDLQAHSPGRHSEQLPRPGPPTVEPRYSESIPRLNPPEQPDGNADLSIPEDGPVGDVAQTNFAGPSVGDTPSLRRNRFSFMRLRHSSDPQLSKSYAKAEEDTPPVPSLPPPKIITTAPTSNELDQPIKQRHKSTLLSNLRKRSMEELSRTQPEQSSVTPHHKGQGSTDSQIADSNLSTSQIVSEEPGRLSTTSLRSGGREAFPDSHRSSVTDPRFSESSRSDHSYADHAASRTNSPLDNLAAAGGKRFRLPRLKRNRSPLFPLPAKLPPPTELRNDGPKIPPAETPASGHSDDQDRVSPLPSPSRSSVGLSSSGPPALLRQDSTTSARSVRSNPSASGRIPKNGRGRSSTMGSLAENQDDSSQAPYLASSGRTSTSTSGRKSFGDMFNFSQRMRQNSEPPIPRNGSPALGGSATPTSKPASLSLARELPPCPEREEGDTPATYLTRLEENLPRGMVGGILAQSDEDFFKVALRKYMRGFAYFGDPIDMAIRKLLMEVDLPKETQQIDRFLQAFADRYHECNPGIFATPDQAYFIAFSILILHTDVFNKNNKRKMQKPDYVKNTRGEGIAEEILECFYENILYTPFIHVEDVNLRDRQQLKPRRALFKSTSSEHLSKISREPVDPYALILDGKLETLRPSLKDVMSLDDTYDHFGTAGAPDMEDLHEAFTKSGILQIISLRSRPDAFMQSSLNNPAEANPGLVDIKVAKVGLIWRKDPKKKRARSPWAEWGAVLTFSQLYFFRNVNWVRNLMAQHEGYVKNGRKGTLVFKPPLSEFKPDAIMSTNDAVALFDSAYKKHKYAFSFFRHNALEEVFLTTSESEMNDWMAKLNYAAAFRTTGVRTKGMIDTNYEGQRYRKTQRAGSISSQRSHQSADNEPASPSIDTDVVAEFITARRHLMAQKIRETNEKLFISQKQLDDLLRNARHLQVLTPVHARARESVILAAGRMAAKVKWVRQDIWRNKCYRAVLLRDLGEDESVVEGTAESVTDQISTHIPIHLASVSGPSVTSGPSADQQAPSIVHTVSSHDTAEQPAAETADRPAELHAQISFDQIRRPSLPTSTASADFARPGRRLSSGAPPDRSKSYSVDTAASQLQREASILSRGSKFDGASLGSRASKLTAPVSFDDDEERLLREAGLLGLGNSPSTRKHAVAESDTGADNKPDESSEVSQSDSKPSRARRSLHRTLRDSHHSHTSRHRKNRGSVSSIGPVDDDQIPHNGEGLSRKTPSFTVHGKKASVVTFGSEWQNMPAEDRLKLRKPTPSDEPRASDPAVMGSGGESITSDLHASGRPHSVHSASTTTGLSMRSDELVDFKDAPEEVTEEDRDRRSSVISSAAPDSAPDQRQPSSKRASMHNGHLAAPGDDRSPSASSTSLGERPVDPPSQENLREQAVGA
ncbi:hypothetical protein N7510_008338 [Penicillium lagena]|uniref:uncharacterized protein n=1 Tax=Penicillium lagena TaxID=94218 RepID=UPI0025416E71|nr:uncharacterized protein N7510_008338 [Penicillium lagena]KAJ5605557.1 hypothetical protein N7510_008338 [Penicillium lagena]